MDEIARIRLFGVVATLTERGWSCSDPWVQRVLDAEFKAGTSGYYPDPAAGPAHEIVRRLGAELLYCRPAPESVPGRIY